MRRIVTEEILDNMVNDYHNGLDLMNYRVNINSRIKQSNGNLRN